MIDVIARFFIVALCLTCSIAEAGAPPKIQYRLVATFPHDADAFTEGLAYINGHLYESTGTPSRSCAWSAFFGDCNSSIREVDLHSGRIIRIHKEPYPLFGEGIAWVDQHWIQLTYQDQFALLLDASFHEIKRMPYDGEGWGLTRIGNQLLQTNGTQYITYRDEIDFRVKQRLAVQFDGHPVKHLNSLDVVGGLIYANIFPTNLIAGINPATGDVVGVIDLTSIRSSMDAAVNDNRDAVANGITHDPSTGHIFVTGKFWPKLFELELTAPQ